MQFIVGADRVRKVASSGIITSVAGTGSTSYLGEGLAATSYNLNNPKGLVISTDDILFIADATNFRIVQVPLSSGIVYTYAGSGVASTFSANPNGDDGAATSCTFGDVTDLFADTLGDLYFADSQNNKVRVASTFSPATFPTLMPSDAPSVASYYGTINGDVSTDNLGQGLALHDSTALIAGHYLGTNVIFVFRESFSQWSYTSILSEFDGESISDDASLALYENQAFVGDPAGFRGAGKCCSSH